MSAPGRKWDESRSPQWKYLLQKESTQRRMTRKEIERERRESENEGHKTTKKKHSDYKRERKRGKNIKRYVKGAGGKLILEGRDNSIMEQVKDEYRTTQSPTNPQE